MTWKKAIGQSRIKKVLQRAIIEDRIPHAYLFWGSEGVGKDALAIEFAKTVNCQNPVTTEDSINYCGECNSCHLFQSLGHPNIQFIFSTPASKSDTGDNLGDDKQIDEISKQIKMKSEDYYHKMQVTGGSQIRIGSIRQIRRNLSMSAGMSGRRVIIVSRADEMSPDSANAFLKTLEEPQDNTTIILTSSRKEILLSTILSRCQLIHVPVLEDDEVYNYALKHMRVNNSEAGIIASYAEGSISRAIEFNKSDIQVLRQDVIELLRITLTPKIYKQNLIQKIDDLTSDKDKRKIEYLLNLMIIWLMDVFKLERNPDSEFIINRDFSETLHKFTSVFGKSDMQEAIKLAEAGLLRIKRNVPLNLILLDLLIQIRVLFLETAKK